MLDLDEDPACKVDLFLLGSAAQVVAVEPGLEGRRAEVKLVALGKRGAAFLLARWSHSGRRGDSPFWGSRWRSKRVASYTTRTVSPSRHFAPCTGTRVKRGAPQGAELAAPPAPRKECRAHRGLPRELGKLGNEHVPIIGPSLRRSELEGQLVVDPFRSGHDEHIRRFESGGLGRPTPGDAGPRDADPGAQEGQQNRGRKVTHHGCRTRRGETRWNTSHCLAGGQSATLPERSRLGKGFHRTGLP